MLKGRELTRDEFVNGMITHPEVVKRLGFVGDNNKGFTVSKSRSFFPSVPTVDLVRCRWLAKVCLLGLPVRAGKWYLTCLSVA